jgi:hypothetical protein
MTRLSWGTGITCVYTAFAVGTLGMVAFAIGHPVDLVGADYYQQSITYDARIAAVSRADEMSEAVTIALQPNGRLQIRLPAAQASRATGTLTLYRPSDASADRQWALPVGAQGAASVPLEGLAAGVWRVRLEWVVDGQTFYREQVVQLP